jgi:hypothetical protein
MTNSYGYDEIPVKIWKNSVQYIILLLMYIINGPIATCTFPDWLKFYEINPIYKKGDKNLVSVIDLYYYQVPSQKYFRKLCIGEFRRQVAVDQSV